MWSSVSIHWIHQRRRSLGEIQAADARRTVSSVDELGLTKTLTTITQPVSGHRDPSGVGGVKTASSRGEHVGQ